MAGYQPHFLPGFEIPLPGYTAQLTGQALRDSRNQQVELFDYPAYSLAVNAEPGRRSPIFVAFNIDLFRLKTTPRKDHWRVDTRIGADYQLNNDYYRSNPWDRGHMARRSSASYGDTLREASFQAEETFYYSNACLQHANLNQDEWLMLEDWVLQINAAKEGKVTTFSGPFYGDYDRSITPDGAPRPWYRPASSSWSVSSTATAASWMPGPSCSTRTKPP